MSNLIIMNKKVVIIDYQMSNLYSVKHACDWAGLNATISSDKAVLANADLAILPGVGAFSDAMANLQKLELIPVIKAFVKSKKPFFGVCLGLQLLFNRSEEFGTQQGLGVIRGKVIRFPRINNERQAIKVPQIGWNKIYCPEYRKTWDDSLLKGLRNNEFMYFVHSYYVVPEDINLVTSQTNYEGVEYCSSIKCGNIFATQFHPEKSGPNGLEIYKNLANNLI